MKRSVAFVVFFLVFGFALAGLYWSQRRAKSIPVSPNAILNMAPDAQRDLARLPMHLTRLSDEQEVAKDAWASAKDHVARRQPCSRSRSVRPELISRGAGSSRDRPAQNRKPERKRRKLRSAS